MVWIIAIFAWWLIGCVGFVYWWTKEYDFDTDGLMIMVIAGCAGILTFIIGYFIHTDRTPWVIIKKRKGK